MLRFINNVIGQYTSPVTSALWTRLKDLPRIGFPRHFTLRRALVTAFMPDALLRAHNLQRPSVKAAWLARTLMKAMALLTRLLPDPQENLQERRRRLPKAGKTAPSKVDTAVHCWKTNSPEQLGSAVPIRFCSHMDAVVAER